jgi:coproporphyrinogen III oxidase
VAFLPANSAHAASALVLVEALQRRMVEAMQGVAAAACDDRTAFVPTAWLRDGGRHGGGTRWGLGDTPVFDRASVNVSQVHYDDEPTKQLGSATALSTIIHPANPHAPSVHLHLSWTQMRDGTGYWRMMSDLNPSIPESTDADAFSASLRRVSGPLYDGAAAQGGRYFWIPALGRHRGVSHFYLEAHDSGSFEDDAALARSIGETTIDTYAALVAASLRAHPQPTATDRATQLAYHTVYFFQVLTLDRGTTSGLLVHDQNDVGILGSLPSHLDRTLLAAWGARVPPEQAPLVSALVEATAGDERDGVVVVDQRDGVVIVDEAKKVALAAAVRGFYRANPRALELQAAGNVIPPTVANHR